MDINSDINSDINLVESETLETKSGVGVKWTRISVKDDVWTLLKEVSKEKGISIAELADEAFSLYFNIPSKEKKEKKEKNKRQTKVSKENT